MIVAAGKSRHIAPLRRPHKSPRLLARDNTFRDSLDVGQSRTSLGYSIIRQNIQTGELFLRTIDADRPTVPMQPKGD
jgi:hypothetical protein